MNRLIKDYEVPPGGFRYTQAETGIELRESCLDELDKTVTRHRRANSLPVGDDTRQEIVDQLCTRLPPGWCQYHDPSFAPVQLVGFQQLIQGTKTLWAWFQEGRRRVDDSEALRRSRICADCPQNQEVLGCTACNMPALKEVIARFVRGGRTNALESRLHGCAVCGCALRAKVWVPLDILQEKQGKSVSYPNWCWMNEHSGGANQAANVA